MSEYLHGAYGDSLASGTRLTDLAASGAIVVVGTAPVNQLALATGESYPVNKPILVNNIAEARKAFGYSDDWASFTLCEAMHHFFETEGVGPLVLINVLDPAKAAHKAATQTSASKTPANNQIVITNADKAILDTLTLQTIVEEGDPVTKVKGTDYTVAYNADKKTITLTGITNLGTNALSVKYYEVDPSGVESTDVIGSTDNLGTNTGLFAVKSVYPLTGMIPAYLMAPGFSGVPAIHTAMKQVSKKVNGHWDMYIFADIPILDADGTTAITLSTAATWKGANGYNADNETVYFPMIEGTDKKKYHLSVIAAANFLRLMSENDGVPFHSASNTDAPIIAKLWMGSGAVDKVIDDQIINENLNKNGIASAAFVGGRWAIWGAHSASYDQTNGDSVNVAETNMMMLFYVTNDFQTRRPLDVDQPLTRNDLDSIAAEEQTRLNALINMGALIYGNVALSAESLANSDVYSGDFTFGARITTTPLAKSLKEMVIWVDEGFNTYFTVANA